MVYLRHDTPGPELGENNDLVGKKAVIAGEHEAEHTGHAKVRQPDASKNLRREKNRCNHRVCHTAEHGRKTDSSRKAGRDSQKLPEYTAKNCSNIKGRNNLPALKASLQRQRREKNL